MSRYTRPPGVLTIRAARPTSVTFALSDRLPYATVRMGAVRAAKGRLESRETVILGGWPLVESDVDTLLGAMRDAQTEPVDVCDDCGEETTGTALCAPCAQRRYDDQLDTLTDRAQEWAR